MQKNDKLEIAVKGHEEIERLILTLTIGFMVSLEHGTIQPEEALFRLFSPFSMGQLENKGINQEVIDVVHKASELEDILELVSKEAYNKAISDIKNKSLDILASILTQDVKAYRHWIKSQHKDKNLGIEINRKDRKVIFLGREIGGCFVDSYCPDCGHQLVFYDRYDEEFCPKCNQWQGHECGDDECCFCKDRPEKPL